MGSTKAKRLKNTAEPQGDDFEMFEVIPRLYISKFPKEIPTEITHVLNMCPHSHSDDSTRFHLQLPLNDIDNITEYVPIIIKFIQSALHQSDQYRILVHCSLGQNRSAAAMLAYLCHRDEISSAEALRFLKERKADVKPSALFLKQIDQFFHREVPSEDPLVGFHKRLQERKKGGLVA